MTKEDILDKLSSIEAKTYTWVITEESAKYLNTPMTEIRDLVKDLKKVINGR